MQFKKPTSLSDTFGDHFDTQNGASTIAFLNSDDVYAVSNGQVILKRFRIIRNDNSYISIPYSTLPILIYKGSELIIKSYGIHIVIFGKGLSIIEQYLNTETLLYIRESPTGIDTNNEDVFIASITIEGKNVSSTISEDEL